MQRNVTFVEKNYSYLLPWHDQWLDFCFFPSKSPHSKRISGFVCIVNQLNCPIKESRLSVSLIKRFLAFFPSNFKELMESTSVLWEITMLLSPFSRSKPMYWKAFLFTEPISKILCYGLITVSTKTCDLLHKKSSTCVTRIPCRVPLYWYINKPGSYFETLTFNFRSSSFTIV